MTHSIEHRFVHYIPDVLEDGVLYVSRRFRVAVHKCCCGCGTETVTPIGGKGWNLLLEDERVSLHPSVGNQKLDCQSHYWIRRNEVVWL